MAAISTDLPRSSRATGLHLLRAWLIGLLAFVFAPSIVQAGIDLKWTSCDVVQSNRDFGCTAGTNQTYTLIVQFTSPVNLPNFVAMTAFVELVNQSPDPLAPFWHYESGGCNAGPTGINAAITLPATCEGTLGDLWEGGSLGTGGIFAYLPNYCAPGMAGQLVGFARPPDQPTLIIAGVPYLAFRLNFSNNKRFACSGCAQGMAIRVRGLILQSSDGSPPVYLSGPDQLSDCATINGGPSALCDLANHLVIYFSDNDGDGFGSPNSFGYDCSIPDGKVTNALDCDDSRGAVYPGAPEFCDGLDNDCDASVDEGLIGPAGIVGWWQGEGNANDAVGSYHGTPQNGVTFVGGQVGQGFRLDGLNDYIDNLGTESTWSFIQNTGVFTIECWIGLDDPNAPREQTIAANIFNSVDKGFYFGIVNSGGQHQLQMALGRGGSLIIDSRSPQGVITTPTWHHVAAVGDGTTVTFYIDGVAYAGSGTMGTLSSGNSTRPVDLGWDNVGSYFGGQLDEVALYDRALSESEIQAIYQAGSGGRCALVSVDGPRGAAAPLQLSSPWPNPSSRGVELELRLSEAQEVRAHVVDIAGRLVATVLEGGELPTGTHRLRWDGRDRTGQRVPAGIYLIRVSTGGGSKMVRTVILG